MAEADDLVEGAFSGLLVKLNINNKLYLIPANSLFQFEYNPTNRAEFDAKLNKKFINVGYAVFREDFTIQGSTH